MTWAGVAATAAYLIAGFLFTRADIRWRRTLYKKG